MPHRLALLGLILSLAASPPAAAISGGEQIRLAGQGRFIELVEKLEALPAERRKTADWHALCWGYARIKRYAPLEPCLQTLEQRVAQGDRRTRLFGLDDVTPAVHILRAETHIELGRYSAAIESAQAALAWFAKEGDGSVLDIRINALAALTLAHALEGRRDEAARHADQLEAVKIGLMSDHGNAKTLALARASMGIGRYPRVVELLQKDTRFSIQSWLDNLISGALFTGASNWVWQELPRGFMLNKALFEMDRWTEAKTGYDRLLGVPQIAENGEIYWLILFDRGRIAEREGEIGQATEFYRRAIEVIERQRSSIHTEANKIGFVGDKQGVYTRLVDLLERLGRVGEAFEYAERAKSRALVDLLAEKSAFRARGLSSPARQTLERYVETELDSLSQPPIAAAEAGTRALRVLKIVEALRQEEPELASLVAVDNAAVSELQRLVEADETLLHYYPVGANESIAFVLTRERIDSVRIRHDDLAARIRQLRERIERRAAVEADARTLHDILLKPLADRIRTPSLLFVPHGALHYLPLAALHDGQDYLIGRRAIRTLPSVTALRYLRPTARAGARTLIFGNPDLRDPGLDLPNAEIEARELAGMLPGAVLKLRGEASKANFQRLARGMDRIHIASHGKFDNTRPMQSALYLAPTAGDDGRLTVAELYDIELDADLVTLSACETGLGRLAGGEELIGLTRGFLFAGTRSIVASLWPVDDAATAALMRAFYAGLARTNKRDALRNAQNATRKTHPHPFYWAAFQFTGNLR